MAISKFDVKRSFQDGAVEMAARYEGFGIYGYSDKHDRPQQEDRMGGSKSAKSEDNSYSLLFVFDGHGNDTVSEYCSQIFPGIFASCLKEVNKDYEAAMRKAFEKTEEHLKSNQGQEKMFICQQVLQKDQKKLFGKKILTEEEYKCGTKSGCTAVVACLRKDNRITVGHLGDARCGYMNFNRDHFRWVTEDHKPGKETEKKRITKAGASVFGPPGHERINCPDIDMHLNVSGAFADFGFKAVANLEPNKQPVTAEPDIASFVLEENEIVILCSDGLYENTTDAVIATTIKTFCPEAHDNPAELLVRIMGIASESKGGMGQRDNSTAIYIKRLKKDELDGWD